MALIAGPLGCLVVWRRLAYFGDTLSHAALLGVALGLLLQVSLTLAVLAVKCWRCAFVLLVLQRRANLSSDALLGLLSHASLAIGMVVLASMTWVRIDLMGLLFGDILAVSLLDIAIIWIGGGVVLAVLATIWRPLFAATVSSELAEAEGMKPARSNLVHMLPGGGGDCDFHEAGR
ncbi:MAG: metal ABC transporter permease [Nitratireductor sp.]